MIHSLLVTYINCFLFWYLIIPPTVKFEGLHWNLVVCLLTQFCQYFFWSLCQFWWRFSVTVSNIDTCSPSIFRYKMKIAVVVAPINDRSNVNIKVRSMNREGVGGILVLVVCRNEDWEWQVFCKHFSCTLQLKLVCY